VLAIALGVPFGTQAESKIPRIGVLSADFPKHSPCVDRLRRGLSELGYNEGVTHALEVRWAEGRTDVLQPLAEDLVGLKVDLLVSAAEDATLAVKHATSTVPIVMTSSFYPVELGLVASLSRPGGNITGVGSFTPDLMARRVQLVKETLPRASRVALLRLPGRIQSLVMRDMEAVARQAGIYLINIEVENVDDLAPAFETAVRGAAEAVMTTHGPFFAQNSARIAQLALKSKIPSFSGEPGSAADGALMVYGPNVLGGCSQAVKYVARILKGARPADLPVEQAVKTELVLNMKTAKALSLTIPPSILQRADHVIE
jgi:putative ABC transport system substrate-binding protein